MTHTHSLTNQILGFANRSFIHLVILSFIHTHFHSFIHSSFHSFIHSFIHLFIHSSSHSFILTHISLSFIQRPMFNSSLNILYPFYADSILPYPDQNIPIYYYFISLLNINILPSCYPKYNIQAIYNYTIYI